MSGEATEIPGIPRVPREHKREIYGDWSKVERVGDYELRQRLGNGKEGVVFLAVDPEGNKFAIKVPRTEEYAEAIVREATIAQILKSFNSTFLSGFIASADAQSPFYPTDPDKKVPYLVMRVAEGGSLQEVVDARRLTPEEAGIIIAQIADALSAMHDKGLTHRDIKPDNVLLKKLHDPQSNPLDIETILSDFGISDEVERVEGEMSGTFSYKAPEEFEGKRTDKSDAFALGCLYYALLTRESPFPKAKSLEEMAEDVRFVRLPNKEQVYDEYLDKKFDEAGIETDYIDALKGVLALDPEKRLTAWDFAYEINAAQIRKEKIASVNSRPIQPPARE